MLAPIVQLYAVHGCESWIMKKAECWRVNAFKLWCWRRFLRVPWKARRSNQSILNEINLEHSLERPAEAETPVRLLPDSKSWLIWKDTDAGKDWGQEDDRGCDGWMASPTRWTWVWANSGRWWWTGRPGVLQSRGSQRVRHDWATVTTTKASSSLHDLPWVPVGRFKAVLKWMNILTSTVGISRLWVVRGPRLGVDICGETPLHD